MEQTKITLFEHLKSQSQKYLKEGKKAEVDFHIHTTHSDGTFSIPEIISLAITANLSKICITDHNTIFPGAQELQSIDASIPSSLEVKIGVEIICKILDDNTKIPIPIEILAYHSNPKQLQEFLNQYKFNSLEAQKIQLQFLMQKCRELSLVFSNNIELPPKSFATEQLCKELIKHPENKEFFMNTHPIVWTTPKLFFKKFCSDPSSLFYFDSTKFMPTYQETVDAIISTGGKASVAHPFLYIYPTEKEVFSMLESIRLTSPITAVEAYHSSQTKKQRDFLVNYAKEHHLLVSGGTDFHRGPETILGFGKEDNILQLTADMISWI